MDDYGKYSVIFNYKDGRGKESSPLYQIITVVDVEAPVLVLPDEGKTVGVKVGTAFKPQFEVSDNVTAKDKLKVYFVVKDSNEAFVMITTSEMVIKKQGVYKIIVYAVDAAGNGVSKSYYVKVG